MRAQIFKKGVRLSCTYEEFIQLRVALTSRRGQLHQLLPELEDSGDLAVTSFYLDICCGMCDEMNKI